MRQDQTIPGLVLEHTLIAMFVVVEDEIEVVAWSFCRTKYDMTL